MKLHESYTASAMMRLLKARYGLNPHGIKQLLGANTKRHNDLLKGREEFSFAEASNIVHAFPELAGRFIYKG